ncbi:23S rRNA (pseudouridine(1915)-N(3))-methyltransferase RlmH [Benzoatithermus flavus]|uniref:Ribosomal RNA large subunit methyltransferase H n=1 Tax=Benzoatithermus flavus TaxID=3108223 RepID=A0ABU8XM44_9PROT
MDLLVVAVGRSRDALTDGLFRDYARRCPWPIRLIEVQPRGNVPPERRKAAEAGLLLAAIPPGAIVVALDERGRDLTSETFAERLGDWRDQGRRAAAFLIGGPDGLAESVLRAADLGLALGRMTWPHRLVRVMLAEQLYRATTILAGHPYHRA